MRIVAVINQKGGVGKTTTVVNIGHKLAMEGRKVLILDLDAQGNVAESLGIEPSPWMSTLLLGQATLEEATMSTSRENLYVVPGDRNTVIARKTLESNGFAEFSLLNILRGRKGERPPASVYDFVLLDMAPSLDIFHVAAVVASDHILVPARLDHLSLVGVSQISETMAEVREKLAGFGMVLRCRLLGILPTFYERSTRESMKNLKALTEAFGGLVMPPIPQDTKLREASRAGKTIWEYAPQSRGALGVRDGNARHGGYAVAAEWVLERSREEA